ncbi:hypothetical protein [Reichenbachiella sp. MSK19-1]|uniref:hypothetical protein n=1 Tax=Reichenbachiella sp. MSK19-1 TaxID=1897631 RepID=UPI000E6BA2A1|nr:hypothetical protein [Reichenbachiella sp. MSK19-1]RJE70350.1 hypothetical protein BGP76_09635 [Reichenbachiella sp. MSK19-1]
MKLSILVTVLLCLFSVAVFGQSDFREGYIVKVSNDTIYGLLDYKSIKASTKKCTFKANQKASKETFGSDELLSYRFIDGKYFVSKTIVLNNVEDHLFLEYLIDGIVDMYFVNDEFSKDHYFFDNGDGVLMELKNDKKELYKDGVTYRQESKEYIGLLKYSFKDSPALASQMDDLKLNHQSLIKVASEYHEQVCLTEECIVFEKKRKKEGPKFGLIVGYNTVSARSKSEYVRFLDGVNFETYTYPRFGLYLKQKLSFINENIFVQYAGTYSQTKFVSTDSVIHVTTRVYGLTLEQSSRFNNSLTFRYEFPQGIIRPTFQFGGMFNYFVETHNVRGPESFWDLSIGQEVYEIEEFANQEVGFMCGIGLLGEIKGKEIFLDFKYQRGFIKGVLYYGYPHLNYNVITDTFLVNLGFQLF